VTAVLHRRVGRRDGHLGSPLLRLEEATSKKEGNQVGRSRCGANPIVVQTIPLFLDQVRGFRVTDSRGGETRDSLLGHSRCLLWFQRPEGSAAAGPLQKGSRRASGYRPGWAFNAEQPAPLSGLRNEGPFPTGVGR